MKLSHLVAGAVSLTIASTCVGSTKFWDVISVLRLMSNTQHQDSQRVVVHVRAENLERAREAAFREACERTYGTTVVSNNEVINGKVSRDRIATSSSCFVLSYDVVDEGSNWIKLDVTTRANNIDARIIHNSTDVKNIDGHNIHAKLKTFSASEQDRRVLSEEVIHGYPKNAYDVKITRASWGTKSNKTTVTIDYNTKFTREYVLALVDSSTPYRQDPFVPMSQAKQAIDIGSESVGHALAAGMIYAVSGAWIRDGIEMATKNNVQTYKACESHRQSANHQTYVECNLAYDKRQEQEKMSGHTKFVAKIPDGVTGKTLQFWYTHDSAKILSSAVILARFDFTDTGRTLFSKCQYVQRSLTGNTNTTISIDAVNWKSNQATFDLTDHEFKQVKKITEVKVEITNSCS